MEKLFYILLISMFAFQSCDYFEYDNYDAPDSGMEGSVVDKKTGEPLQTETGASFKIEYYELSWEEAGHANTESRFFWGKADGTFKNSKIFSGKYRITLKEGAFHSPEVREVILNDGKLTNLDYEVVPYGRVKISDITLAGDEQNNLIIKYVVEDTETEVDLTGIDEDIYLLETAQIFLSRKSPNVGINNTETAYTLNAKKDISDYVPGTPKTYTETNVKGLPSGTWWIRVGVRTGNPQKRFNFSPVQEITIPEGN